MDRSSLGKRRRGATTAPDQDEEPETKRPAGHKRGWESWSVQEKDIFFAAVNKHGRNFESITKEVKTKNYDQVRHFYYRVLKKINKILNIKIDNKDQKEVLHALACFWQLKKGTDNEKDEFTKDFASSLSQMIGKKPPTESVPRPPGVPSFEEEEQPMKRERALPKIEPRVNPDADVDPYVASFASFQPSGYSQRESPSQIRIPEKLSIQLTPRTTEIAEIISRSGHNPRLQLTLRSKKIVAQMIEYLEQKWVLRYENGECLSCITGPIRFFPPAKLYPNHPGWGREDNITVEAIFMELNYPSPMRLEYSWPLEVAVLEDSVDGIVDTSKNEGEITTESGAAGYDSPKQTMVVMTPPAASPTTPNSRYGKIQTGDSLSLFEDTSCDGFGSKIEYAEAACRDFYNNFESFEHGEKDEKSYGKASFKNILNK